MPDTASAKDASADADVNVFDVATFCRRNGIGRTTVYRAAREGKLKMRKMFGKTVVTVEDEAAFLRSLPEWTSSAPVRRRRTRPTPA